MPKPKWILVGVAVLDKRRWKIRDEEIDATVQSWWDEKVGSGRRAAIEFDTRHSDRTTRITIVLDFDPHPQPLAKIKLISRFGLRKP